ncbi:cytochrome c [Emticicia sp. BO119]|uniref:c-type cytochrome n=1 Tax=Emticicia sp. BO119 TaxID=2757768 RepID=UPI0015EFEAEB|nr:cytochrome c [Emticicia sp. BO119]MBA4849120.1 cytochrome c [Emticicia sp. BO119]
MDIQKTIIKVLELFKTLAILYALSIIIFTATAFYYINQDNPPQQSSVNHVLESPVTENIQLSESATKGMEMFKGSCAQCHTITTEVMVGPGLQGIEERRNIKWIREWIRNSPKVIASKDKYAVELFNRYNKTQMSTFPNLKDEDIDAILNYIEEGRRDIVLP